MGSDGPHPRMLSVLAAPSIRPMSPLKALGEEGRSPEARRRQIFAPGFEKCRKHNLGSTSQSASLWSLGPVQLNTSINDTTSARSSSSEMTPNWGDQAVHWREGLPSRGIWAGWRNGPSGISWNPTRTNATSCTWEGWIPCSNTTGAELDLSLS